MARQVVSVEVRQQHSGGDLTVALTYTSDGVVVKRLTRKVRVTGGGTADMHLADTLFTEGVRQARIWEAQELLW